MVLMRLRDTRAGELLCIGPEFDEGSLLSSPSPRKASSRARESFGSISDLSYGISPGFPWMKDRTFNPFSRA